MAFRFADCELRDAHFELHRKGKAVPVEPKVLQLLLYLVRNRARAVTRTELLEHVWSDVKVGNASLTRAVVEARRAIGDEAQEMIHTVRGIGFRFAAPVVEVAIAGGGPPPSSLVGRDAPLAALGAQLERVVSGRSALALISGVAGIGKTRLLEELTVRARARDVDVHVARCHESPAQPSFRPWTTILEALAAQEGAEGEAARAASAMLAQRGASIDAFDAVARAVAALGRRRPRLLAIDDVHWADGGTLDLVRFFAREARDAGVFVACTFREVAGEDGAARSLGSLLCEYDGVSIPLRGLPMDQTSALLKLLRGVEPSDAFAKEVHERTGGCPLFVRQLLETEWAQRAMDAQARTFATSIDMKRGLIDSVSRHLEGVSAACRDVLVWAAVLGKSFGFAPLSRMTGLAPEALLNHLEDARRAHLVQRSGEGEFRFVHPLVADVLYDDLAASERAGRHLAAARALEAQHAAALDLHASRIARHFVRAAPMGVAREAYDYCARAARHAEAKGDTRDTTKHWERAMRVLDLMPTSEEARLDVLRELARAYVRAADAHRARDALLDAAMLARALGHPDVLAEVALELAGLVPPGDAHRQALLAEARSAVERAKGPAAEALVRQLDSASR